MGFYDLNKDECNQYVEKINRAIVQDLSKTKTDTIFKDQKLTYGATQRIREKG